MFKSKITWILFMLIWMLIIAMQSYNGGYDRAKDFYEDQEAWLKRRHADEIFELQMKIRELQRTPKSE